MLFYLLFHFVQNCPEEGEFKVLNDPPGSVFIIRIDALIKVGLPPELKN